MRDKKTIVLTFFMMAFVLPSTVLALACGDRVVRNEVLTADLHCTTGFYALEVVVGGVTIDFNGYSISGDPALAGIVIVGKHDVTIKNGVIKDFWAGINTADADRLDVSGMTFDGVGSGVIVSSGNQANIRYNGFYNTWSDAVGVYNFVAGRTASNHYIDGNEFYENKTAIHICGADADDNMIVGNFIWKTHDYGIHLVRSDRNFVTQNTIIDSNNTAVRLDSVNDSNLIGNSIQEGFLGVSLLADAGSACFDNGVVMNHRNKITNNHIMKFNTGVTLGVGSGGLPLVFDNTVRFNKLYDNGGGLYFLSDAHHNDARTNGYTGTATPITDLGTGNLY
ncbi:NosD domain-containing protein [Marinicella sp. W31]|uniref:NosD domain-containing protein n=1 Tax=Marinicella sp. W31 TaxID=3023713 RepID=UPI0037573E2D